MEYDVFICHAHEDKKKFVKHLADALSAQNLKVWYDEFELTLGDSLRDKIDYGLGNSRYGIVVLSKAFFAKKWTKEELDGLMSRQTSEGRKVILPIWFNVNVKDVKKYSPILAGKIAARSDEGIQAIVKEILAAIESEGPEEREPVPERKGAQSVVTRILGVLKRKSSAQRGSVLERSRPTGMKTEIGAQVEQKVIEIVCEQLGLHKSEITYESTFDNDLNADSLATVEFIMECEDEFDITIPDEEAEKIQTVRDAIDYITKAVQSK